MEWEDNNLKSAMIFSKKGGDCKIRIQDKIMDLTLKAGEKRELIEL